MGDDQQFCLKWNNHRKTLFTVFDNLLEEESLVDVALMADGKIIKAHRVILSACSPYFKAMLKEPIVGDKLPIFILKDVDIENLRSLIEYMYKGEVNVQQSMFASFIKAAESLQIRGLADKHIDDDNLRSPSASPSMNASHNQNCARDTPPPSTSSQPHHSTPIFKEQLSRKRGNGLPPPTMSHIPMPKLGLGNGTSGGGILAQHLTKTPTQFSFPSESILQRQQNLPLISGNPPTKKPRKSEPRQTPSSSSNLVNHLSSPPLPPSQPSHASAAFLSHGIKEFMASLPLEERLIAIKNLASGNFVPPKTVPQRLANNNNYDHDDRASKIEDDIDPGKENRMETPATNNDDNDEPIDASNGVSSEDEEEEPSMPGPQVELGEAARIINPWTGEQIKINDDQDDSSTQDGDSHIYPPSLLETSMLNRSDLSFDGMLRGNGSSLGDSQSGDTSQKYSCSKCGRNYLHQATLVRHQRYECGISASYPCSLCGRKFKRRDVLKGHMEKCVNKSTVAAVQAASLQALGGASASTSSSSSALTNSPGNPLAATSLALGSGFQHSPPSVSPQ